MQLASESAAQALGPAAFPEATRKQDLAKYLDSPRTEVIEAKGYDLRAAEAVSGFVLGRYREGMQRWAFPVLGVYYACATGTCISLLRLGAAVGRLAPLSLLDLEQPVAEVSPLEPDWLLAQVPEPGRRARWPVLLLVSESQQEEPAVGGAQARGRGTAARTEQTLYVVSLRVANAPKLLYSRRLLERWPEPEGARPPPRRLGSRVEALRLGRQGADLVMTVSERDIDSRYSRALRPAPVEQRYRLVKERFQELADPRGPLAPTRPRDL